MTPAWLLDAVAALMLAVAAVSTARLATARPWRRGTVLIDTDVAHLLMAVAMAGMLAPDLRTLPDVTGAVIFGLLTAWFGVRVARDARGDGLRALAGGHCAPHLVHSGSMLYMLLAMRAAGAATGGMRGMTAGSGPAMTLAYPTLALAFAFVLVGYSVWDLDQLSGRRYGLAVPRVPLAATSAPGTPVRTLPVLTGAEPAAPGPPRPSVAWSDAGGAQSAGQDPGAVAGDAGARSFLLSPAVTVGCRIAMGVAMAFMLFIAI